jgi:hypothetical protein
MNVSIHGERTVSEPQDRVTETHRATDGHVGSAARHCELAARLAAHLRRHPRQRIAPSMEKYASFGSPNAVISRHGRSQNISIRGRRK